MRHTRETDRLGNIWETRRLSEIDSGFRPVRNPAEYRDIYGKYYDPEVWVIVGKEALQGGKEQSL